MNPNPSIKKLLLLSIALVLLTHIGNGQILQFSGKVKDSLSGVGIGDVEIVVRDIYNGTIYRQCTSNAEGDFAIEVPASQRVELGVFHEKYMDKTLNFDAISTMHSRKNPSIFLQGERGEAKHKLIIRPVSVDDVKISSALLTIRNEATGELIEKHSAEADRSDTWRLQLNHGHPYTFTLQADGFFERKWSFVWNEKGLEQGDIDWDFFKSEDTFSTTRENYHIWKINLWPNSLNAAFELRDIDFSPGESYILPKSVKVLDKLMLFLERYSGVVFELQHHSNDWGDYHRDLLFSQWRAQVLLDYLAERGELPSAQLAARGLGHALLDKSCEGAIQCQSKYSTSEVLHDHTKTTLKVIAYNLKQPNTQQGGYYDHNKDETTGSSLAKRIETAAVSRHSSEYNAKGGDGTQNLVSLKDESINSTDKSFNDKFTGYAVQILKTKHPLPDSHPIWSVEGIWVDRQGGNGHAYLVGNFSEKEKGFAKANSMRKQYEGAFVVSYFNGERLY